MRKGLSILLILVLLRFVATGQTLPTLQITNNNYTAEVSWSVGSFPLYSLQTTTNLSPPITWSNQSLAYGTGTTDVAMTDSQQFFRLAELTPIFQFAIFYNLNMEINTGFRMTFNGPVYCNASIWAASSSVTFSNSVDAVGFVSTNYMSPGDPFMTPSVKTGSGNPHFIVPPMTGAGVLNLAELGTNNDPAAVEALLQLPPMPLGTESAYSPTGQIYFANQANLIITNTSSGGRSTLVYWQDSLQSPSITPVPYDYYIVSNKTVHVRFSTNTVTGLSASNYITLYSGYIFVTNSSFYDYREAKTVQAIYLNVTNLNYWLTNTAPNQGSFFNQQTLSDTGHGINSVYIYNSVPMTGSTLPGVQIINGAQLSPDGLAIATPNPLYVKGNFNSQTPGGSDAGLNDTTYTYPAALFADAITVLSSNWSDTYSAGTPLSSRIGVSITVNAAVFEGIVPSSGANYSGGVENFLRLQEDWNSSSFLTYNGSIVVMFPSQYATNIWNGNVYGVPTLHWAFDQNFTNEGGLPPFTPSVVNLVTR